LYGLGTLTARFPQERLHYLGYGLLAGLLYAGWRGVASAAAATTAGGSEWLRPALLTVLVGSGIGLLDELLQILWPRRYFDWADVLINVLSVAVGVIVAIPVVSAFLHNRTAGNQG
jgi:VanZ family protein